MILDIWRRSSQSVAIGLALVLSLSVTASAAPGSSAPGPMPSVATKICSAGVLGNKDLNGYKRFHNKAIAALKDQLRQCYAVLRSMEYDARGGGGPTPAHPLSRSQVDLCNPDQINDQDDPNVVATLLNSYCAGLVALRPPAPFQATAAQLLFTARNPTLYVVTSSGGLLPSSATSTPSSGSGTDATQPATNPNPVSLSVSVGSSNPTTPTAGNTNLDALLLFKIARQIQDDYCVALAGSFVDSKTHRCNDQKVLSDGPERPLAVVPEGQWTLEDLRTQCVGDPYVDSPAPHGTLGAIVINGTTSTQDGSFLVALVRGGAAAHYTAEVLGCRDALDGSVSSPVEQLWNSKISSSVNRSRVSFFLPALVTTVVAANVTAKSVFLPQPTVGAPNSLITQYSSAQVAGALGSFAAGTAGYVFGNPHSGIAVRDALDTVAHEVGASFATACKRYHDLQLCKVYHNVP